MFYQNETNFIINIFSIEQLLSLNIIGLLNYVTKLYDIH